MKDVKERIDGSFRLIAFRRLKKRIFLMEVILLLSMAFVIMAIMGASLNPFYMPMDYFLLIMLVLAMLLVPEMQYLSLLEIAQTKSKSGKYLMARNNVRNATAVIVLCVFFVVLFVLPPSVRAMEDGYTATSLVAVPSGEVITYNFTSRDSMGTRTVNDVRFEPLNGDVSVYVMRYEDWAEGGLQPGLSENLDDFVVEDSALRFSPSQYVTGYQRYVVSMNVSGQYDVSVQVTIAYEISEVITGYMPFMGIVFIVIEGLTISYFLPIREKYSASSIFSKSYVEQKDAGSEKLSEREAAFEKALSDDEIVHEAELSEPSCIPDSPKDIPAVQPAQARKKGVLDVGAASTADVSCKHCGAMNSADAALCFSCGNAIETRDIVQMGPADLMTKGREFLSYGRSQDAIWCFDEVLKVEHKNEEALYLKAKALVGGGRLELAIQYLNTVIQLCPTRQDAHLMRGSIFEKLDMLERAADSYEKALALGPSDLAASKLKEFRECDREEVLNQFMTLPGIGPAKASALYDAGFTSVETLRGASMDALCKVKGINERLAKRMLKEMGRES